MAIIIKTSKPQDLIQKINMGIREASISTWKVDNDGDYTHVSTQWKERMWLHPNIQEEQIVFSTICRKDSAIKVTEYGAYHGFFVQMILDHFDSMCSDIQVTPLPHKLDRIRPREVADKQYNEERV